MKKLIQLIIFIFITSNTFSQVTAGITGSQNATVGDVVTYQIWSHGANGWNHKSSKITLTGGVRYNSGGQTVFNLQEGEAFQVRWECNPGSANIKYDFTYKKTVLGIPSKVEEERNLSVSIADFATQQIIIEGPENFDSNGDMVICYDDKSSTLFEATNYGSESHLLWRVYEGNHIGSAPSVNPIIEFVDDLSREDAGEFIPDLPADGSPSTWEYTIEAIPFHNQYCLKPLQSSKFFVKILEDAVATIDFSGVNPVDASGNCTGGANANTEYRKSDFIILRAIKQQGDVMSFSWDMPETGSLEICETNSYAGIPGAEVKIKQAFPKLNGDKIKLRLYSPCSDESGNVAAEFEYQPELEPMPIDRVFGPQIVCLDASGSKNVTYTALSTENSDDCNLTISPTANNSITKTHVANSPTWSWDVDYSAPGSYTLDLRAQRITGLGNTILGESKTLDVIALPQGNPSVLAETFSDTEISNGAQKTLSVNPCEGDHVCANKKILKREVVFELKNYSSVKGNYDVEVSYQVNNLDQTSEPLINKTIAISDLDEVSFLRVPLETDNFSSVDINTIQVVNHTAVNGLELIVKIEDEVAYEISQTEQYIGFVSSSNPSLQEDYIILDWDDACVEFNNYQIQILKLYNSDQLNTTSPTTVKAKINWANALTIETQSEVTDFKFRPSLGNGYYVWRVRPISKYFEGGESDLRNFGQWSTPCYSISNNEVTISSTINPCVFYFNEAPEDKNWVYSRSFIEADKKSKTGIRTFESIGYANGLGMSIQNLAASDVDGDIVANQTIYDFLGRPVLNTIPVPLYYQTTSNGNKTQFDNNGLFAFRNGLVKDNSGNTYSASNFDSDSKLGNIDPVRTNSGDAYGYYSDNNEDLTIPSAEGYPFSRSLFYPDKNQQVKTSFAPGATFTDLVNSKSAKYEYSVAADAELIRIFGSDAPVGTSVQVQTVTDANGVRSLSYINTNGQIIATALEINGQNEYGAEKGEARLDGLESELNSTFNVSELLNHSVQTTPTESVIRATRTFSQPTNVAINYTITPAIIDACNTICKTCDYEILIEIIDINDKNFNRELSQLITISPQDCSNSGFTSTPSSFAATEELQGQFMFQRTLRVKNRNALGNSTYLTDHIRSLRSSLEQEYNDLIPDEILAYLNGTNLDDENNPIYNTEQFYKDLKVHFSLGSVDLLEDNLISIPHSGCTDIEIPITYCKEESTDSKCQTAGTIGFEEYFVAYWAHQGAEKFEIYLQGDPIIPYQDFLLEFGITPTSWTISPTGDTTNLTFNIAPGNTLFFAGNTRTQTTTSSGNEDIYEFKGGEFNTMVYNMINEQSAYYRDLYDCDELFNKWKTFVHNYPELLKAHHQNLNKLASRHGLTASPQPELNLVKDFLSVYRRIDHANTTKNIADPYSTSLPNGPEWGYRSHAYRTMYYDFSVNSNSDCESLVCYPIVGGNPDYTQSPNPPASENYLDTYYDNVVSPRTQMRHWDQFFNCVEGSSRGNNAGVSTINSIQDLVNDMNTDCDSVCDSKLEEFKQAIIKEYYDKNIYVTGINTPESFALKQNHLLYPEYTYDPNGEVGSHNGTIDIGEINCMASALVTQCKIYGCAVIKTTAKEPGPVAQLTKWQEVMAGMFKLELNIPNIECITINTGIGSGQDKLVYNQTYNLGSTCNLNNSSYGNFCFTWYDSKSSDGATAGIAYDPAKILSCEEELSELILENIQKSIQENIEKEIKNFIIEYNEKCVLPENINEQFSISYNKNIHHYTLYYYDRNGRLIKTVPPEGVNLVSNTTNRSAAANHDLETTYEYNSLNWLVKQNTPDGGETNFWYNDEGQLRFSQNAAQLTSEPPTYSYTKYDDLGRIKEIGVSEEDPTSFGERRNVAEFPTDLSLKKEVVKTYYTDPNPLVNLVFPSGQENIRNRVSYTEHLGDNNTSNFDDKLTIYSYDAHGNVKWMMQKNRSLISSVEYEYDLFSGNVISVVYNRNRKDQFYHRYTYDEQNRISRVETSDNGYNWDLDVYYEYYAHGPLKRKEIGSQKLQGLDYVYTLNGWLKAINSPDEDKSLDPGLDGTANDFSEDVYALQLKYFSGDFNRDNSPYTSTSMPNDPISHNLYNGNISALAYRQEAAVNFTGNTEKRVGFAYRYDLLNRLKNSIFSNFKDNWADYQEYSSSLDYDANGNIKSLLRTGNSNTSIDMDDLDYTYLPGTNKLTQVKDHDVNLAYTMDFQGTSNYQYDNIGNLIADSEEEIENIVWTASGKIKEIIRTSTSIKPNLSFEYDAMGNRVLKRVKIGSSYLDWENYYYLRDAQGNPMATYKGVFKTSTGATPYVEEISLIETPIYGSERLGLRNKEILVKTIDIVDPENIEFDGAIELNTPATAGVYNLAFGNKRYELKNHLGNVQTVVSDKKTGRAAFFPVIIDQVGISVTNEIISKTGSNSAWDAGAASLEQIAGNGGVIRQILDPINENKQVFVGLSYSNTDAGYLNIDYAMQTNNANQIRIFESGTYISYIGIASLGDILKVERIGNEIVYSVNEIEKRRVTESNPGQPLQMDCSIKGPTRLILGLKMFEEQNTDIVSATDYYPFGSVMPGRSFSGESYRYGFNGKEKDPEGMGGGGATYDYGFRIYNPQIGKFLSVDPLTKSFPFYTPYQYAGNKPINSIDLDGLEEITYLYNLKDDKYTLVGISTNWDVVDKIINIQIDEYALKKVKNRLTGDFETNYVKVNETTHQVDFVKNANSDATILSKSIHKFIESGSETDRAEAERYSKHVYTGERNIPIVSLGTFEVVGSGDDFGGKYGSWGEFATKILQTQKNMKLLDDKYPGAIKYMAKLILSEYYNVGISVNANTIDDNNVVLNWFVNIGVDLDEQNMSTFGNFFEYKIGTSSEGVNVTGDYKYKITNEEFK